jgi:hypothetical protein
MEVRLAIMKIVEDIDSATPESKAILANAALDLTKVWGIFYSYEQSAAIAGAKPFMQGQEN